MIQLQYGVFYLYSTHVLNHETKTISSILWYITCALYFDFVHVRHYKDVNHFYALLPSGYGQTLPMNYNDRRTTMQNCLIICNAPLAWTEFHFKLCIGISKKYSSKFNAVYGWRLFLLRHISNIIFFPYGTYISSIIKLFSLSSFGVGSGSMSLYKFVYLYLTISLFIFFYVSVYPYPYPNISKYIQIVRQKAKYMYMHDIAVTRYYKLLSL